MATTIVNKENTVISTLETIIADCDKNTLKVSLSTLESLSPAIVTMRAENKEVYLDDCRTSKTKKAFKITLESLLSALLLGMGNKDEHKKKEAQERLVSYAERINNAIDNTMNASLSIGALLTEALNTIKDIGGKQSDFLVWAEENCSIKKAQAYKLMSVYKSFGQESTFYGVSMRVLYALVNASPDIVEEAKVLAEKKKLDSPALAKIFKAHEPIADKTPTVITAGGTPAIDGSNPGNNGSLVTSGLNAKFDTSSNVPGKKADKPEIQASTLQEFSETTALKTTIESLNDTIAALQKQITSLQGQTRKVAPAVIPELLQFDSKVFSTVLGIDPDMTKDKEAINKAYRSLAKIYTAALAPAASKKIRVARDIMLAEIEK